MKFLITLITCVAFFFSSSAMAEGVVKSEKIFPGGKFDASKMMVNGLGGIGEFGVGEANGTPDNNNIQGASLKTDLTDNKDPVTSTYNVRSHITAVGGAPLTFSKKGGTSDCQMSAEGVLTLGSTAGTCEIEVVAAKVYPGCTANTCNPKVYPTTEARKLITFNVSICADDSATACKVQAQARAQAIFDTAEKARIAKEAEDARVATAAAAEAKRVAAEEEAKQKLIAEAKHAAEAVAEAARVRLAAEAAAAEAAEKTRLAALAAAEAAKKVRLAAEALAAEQAAATAAAAAAAAEVDRVAKAAIQAAKDLLAREQAKVIALPAKGIAYKTKKTTAFRDLMIPTNDGTWTLQPAATPFDWAAPNGLYGPVLNSGQGDQVHALFAGYILWPGIKGQSTTVQFADICDDGFLMYIASQPGIGPRGGFNAMNNYIDQGPGFWWGGFNGGPFSVTRVAGEAYAFEINYFEAYGHATCSLYWNAGNGKALTYANKQLVPGASLACSANAWPGVKTYSGTVEARCQ
ncbi:hypothetical protein MCEMOHM34_01421 [Candidatus Methylopumilus universalis]|uniref:hypothetical protein n=1 Tax=Candidatus Methylopumilus universalis TaxID=2588536 RepID=UPI003BEF2258